MRLIVGLGNPGEPYEHTRHNVGARIVKKLARQEGCCFSLQRELAAQVAAGVICGVDVRLILPTTYMNESGMSVRRCTERWVADIAKDLLVISDDVALPLGTLRLRKRGSSGGHRGLENIEAQLGSQEFPRLRVGVGREEGKELARFVLEQFLPNEEGELEQVFVKACEMVEAWLQSQVEGRTEKIHKEQAKE